MESTKGKLQYIPESTDYIGKQYGEECFKGVIHAGELNMAVCVVVDDCVDGEANARRIVKAVNSYDAMYEALEVILIESDKGAYKDTAPIAMAQFKVQRALALARKE